VTVPVLAAVTGASWEAALVAGLERTPTGITVVRRCVDLADLLAAASTGTARAALLSAELRRLDRDALARLAAARVAVVGLFSPGDEEAETRLRQLGVVHVLSADSPATEISVAVSAALGEQDVDADRAATGWSQPLEALPHGDAPADPGAVVEPGTGRLVAVWGPTGAPGRTTVAVNVAAELAASGVPTLLADADVYGGVVAQVLGFLDEAPGLAAVARLANNGQLDLAALAAAAPLAGPNLRVLTGISRADRWPELRPSALEQVWALARSLAAVTVVDVGFCLEQDEELSFDTAAPRRNGATLATLDAADTVLAVGAADPVGCNGWCVASPSCVRPSPARCHGWCSTGCGAAQSGPSPRRSSPRPSSATQVCVTSPTCPRTGRLSTPHCCRPAPCLRSTGTRGPGPRWPASPPPWSAGPPRGVAVACSAGAHEGAADVADLPRPAPRDPPVAAAALLGRGRGHSGLGSRGRADPAVAPAATALHPGGCGALVHGAGTGGSHQWLRAGASGHA
jgi:Mrp family chromosome partitioning ATPase